MQHRVSLSGQLCMSVFWFLCSVMLGSPAHSEIALVQNPAQNNCMLNINYSLIDCYCVIIISIKYKEWIINVKIMSN